MNLKWDTRGKTTFVVLIHRKMSCELTINPRIYFLSSVLDISWNWKFKPSSSQKSKSQNKTKVIFVFTELTVHMHIGHNMKPWSCNTKEDMPLHWLFSVFFFIKYQRLSKSYVQNFTQQLLEIPCQNILRTQKNFFLDGLQRKLNKRGPLRVFN